MSETEVLPKEEKQEKKPIALNRNAMMAPQDNVELVRMLETIKAGGGFPARFDNPAKQVAAYNLARSLMGDRWQLALNNIAEIKGQMCIYGEIPRAIAELTKEVGEFKVYVIDGDYKEICPANMNLQNAPWAGICEVKRKGREKKVYSYTLQEAENAGQYPAMKFDKYQNKLVVNNDSPWMKFTKIMLMRKAQAIAVKFEFPDAMVGAPIAEYEHDAAPDLESYKDVTASTTVKSVQDLNERFG